ncbi:transcriptional regulator GcvA [Pigmentiphaga soli]|uniref:Transcriptional regulator GcvA n=1 Tax=Pigmentiphaga soli TaxID=1007095 RepID=A0ABP8GM66_9BURK
MQSRNDLRLPPLNPLRVFEAVGRYGSITAAAEELHVTPGAVSRQLKSLEDYLGLALFVRRPSGLMPTAHGEAYHRSVREALLQLEQKTRELLKNRQDEKIRVYSGRAFLRYWLIPRLPRFHQRYPNVQTVFTGGGSNEHMAGDVDLAICFGSGDFGGVRAHRLMQSSMTPVCSAAYLQECGPLSSVTQIIDCTLLQGSSRASNWEWWFDHFQLRPSASTKWITFEGDVGVAYRAAASGLGIALGRRQFIESELEAGRLIAPFDVAVDFRDSFYLLEPAPEQATYAAQAFRDWLLEETHAPLGGAAACV